MRLVALLWLFQAATRLAAVAYFVRGMLGIILHADGVKLEDGEFWYRESPGWGVS